MRASTVAFTDNVYFEIKELSEARRCTFSAWVNAALEEALRRERAGVPVVIPTATKQPLMTALGAEVRRQRKALGWSQAQLATYLNSTQPAVSSLEGGVMPMAKLREAVATWLGVSFADVGVMARTFLKSVPTAGAETGTLTRTVAIPRAEVLSSPVSVSPSVPMLVPDDGDGEEVPPHTDADFQTSGTDADPDPYYDDGFYSTLLAGDTAAVPTSDDDDDDDDDENYDEQPRTWPALKAIGKAVQDEERAGYVGWLAIGMDGVVLARGATKKDVVPAARRVGGVVRLAVSSSENL